MQFDENRACDCKDNECKDFEGFEEEISHVDNGSSEEMLKVQS
jgi:hypothetical protein